MILANGTIGTNGRRLEENLSILPDENEKILLILHALGLFPLAIIGHVLTHGFVRSLGSFPAGAAADTLDDLLFSVLVLDGEGIVPFLSTFTKIYR